MQAPTTTRLEFVTAAVSVLIASASNAQVWNSSSSFVKLNGGATRATATDYHSGCFDWNCSLFYCWEDSIQLGSETNWEGALLAPHTAGSTRNFPPGENGKPCAALDEPGLPSVQSVHGATGHSILAKCGSSTCGACPIKHPEFPDSFLQNGASAIAAAVDLEFEISQTMTLRVRLDGSKVIYRRDPCGLNPTCRWLTAYTTPVSFELWSLDDANFRISLLTQSEYSPPEPPYRGIAGEPHALAAGRYRVLMRAWGFATDYNYDFPGKSDMAGYDSAWFSGQFKLQPAAASCEQDLDANGTVDSADLSLLLLDYGPCPSCQSDLDWNLEVDGSDLSLLLLSWGVCSDA